MDAQPPKFADLRVRLVSAIVLGGVALLMIWLGGVWAAALIAAMAAAMAWEWRAITHCRGAHPGAGGIAAAGACGTAVLTAEVLGPVLAPTMLAAGVAGLAAADLMQGRRTSAVWTIAGLTIIGGAAIALLALRNTEPHGFISALWVVIVVAGADTGGYFAGRLIGGPKLWPSVSPKKSWAGLFGGIALAAAGGGLFSWATTGTYYYEVCTVSAAAAILAQAGDLAESAVKRHFGVKDAGSLFPGHGGALDRFDGLMAATIVAAVVTFWRGKTVFIW